MKTTFDLVLLANDNNSRQKGLMFTEPLKQNEAALFIFPASDVYSFWNKNVSYPIEVWYFDENFILVDIQTLKAEQKESVISKEDAKYIVELPEGASDMLKDMTSNGVMLIPGTKQITIQY